MTSHPYVAGIDWASQSHAVCVLDAAAGGGVEHRFDVPHDKEGIERLVRQLKGFAGIAVAIERPSGLLVDALVEAGLTVVPIHPNVLKASRARYRGAGKSDPGDAYMLADILRTDGHRFRALAPQSDEIRALRALVRTRDDLVAERVALANQLTSLLQSFWPGAAEIFFDITSPIALAFVARYPTPHSAARLGEKRLSAFLAQHGYCGRRPVGALLERLRQAPNGQVGELETEAKGELVCNLASILERLGAALAGLSARIEHTVANLADGQIIMSFPRSGRICAAQILAELGSVRERFPTEAQLAAEAGVAPVTFASGKHRSVVFRFACNHRLRRAITCLADQSRHAHPWAADVYRRARARGCDHPHAIRILGRAWTRVIWRAWFTRTLYQPHLHRSAAAFIEPKG